MGAVAWGQWPTPRFPSPLIEPDIPISGIRLVWGFSCQGGPQHDLLFLSWPFLLFDRAAGFLPSRPQDTKADARSGGQGRRVFFSAARRALVLDRREDGGML
jgi:hypothetical protein